MANWNDDRLDKRDEEVKEGFARLEAQIKESIAVSDRRATQLEHQMKEGFAAIDKRLEKIDARFERSDDRFAALNRTLLAGFLAIDAVLLTAIAASLT